MDDYMIDPNLDFFPYYKNQVAYGISNGHSGNRYHVGNGMWSSILETLKPAWQYIKKFGWSGAEKMGSELLNGKSFADAGASALIKTSEDIINEANEKLSTYKKKRMTGRGRTIKKVYKEKQKPTTSKTRVKPASKSRNKNYI